MTTALLNTGSPGSFVSDTVVDQTLERGSLSEACVRDSASPSWGDFGDGPALEARKSVRITVLFTREHSTTDPRSWDYPRCPQMDDLRSHQSGTVKRLPPETPFLALPLWVFLRIFWFRPGHDIPPTWRQRRPVAVATTIPHLIF